MSVVFGLGTRLRVRMRTKFEKGRTKFTTSGAHDVIEITSPYKNDLCTKELRDKSQVTGRGQSTT